MCCKGIQQDTELPMMKLATVDIDRTFVHWDYNKQKVEALLAEVGTLYWLSYRYASWVVTICPRPLHYCTAQHPQVVLEQPGPPFYLLRSTDNRTSVRKLCAENEIETNRQYVHRSRQALNSMRAGAP
jgi:hypothetical protein